MLRVAATHRQRGRVIENAIRKGTTYASEYLEYFVSVAGPVRHRDDFGAGQPSKPDSGHQWTSGRSGVNQNKWPLLRRTGGTGAHNEWVSTLQSKTYSPEP